MIQWVVFTGLILFFIYFFYSTKENFHRTSISIKEFNDLFDASMIELPKNLFALGIDNGSYYTYGNINENGETLISYWMEYINPFLNKSNYYILICHMDGYLEYIEYSENELEDVVPDQYTNQQYIEEVIGQKYPIFHKKKNVFAMCKKINDTKTLLLADSHYIRSKGYTKEKEQIDSFSKPFQKRKSECIWRGTLENGKNFNFFNLEGKDGLNQRNYFKKLYEENRFQKVNFKKEFTSMKDQMDYKYILDIDGYSNTWDSTVWKLYSGSVLLKVKSKWKQWYYDDLKEWIHYVPVENDFSDLNDKIEWCIHNDSECERIVENAKQFVLTKLTWEQVKLDTIKNVKTYLS